MNTMPAVSQALANAERVVAIELLAAAQGIDFLRPLESSPTLEAAHRAIRARAPLAGRPGQDVLRGRLDPHTRPPGPSAPGPRLARRPAPRAIVAPRV